MKYKPVRTSSVEAYISEGIVMESKSSILSAVSLLETVKYDNTEGNIRFLSLNELWEYGFFEKRYLECPKAILTDYGEFFGELSFYIQQGDYVTHYIDYKIISDYTTPLLIKDIIFSEKKVLFYSWHDNRVKEYKLSFQEYIYNFISGVVDEKVAKFDIYHAISDNNLNESGIKDTEKNILDAKIESLSKLNIITRMNSENIKKSIIVLEEWYEIFRQTAPQIIGDEIEEIEVFNNNSDDYSKKRLLKMVRSYNKMIDKIRPILVGRKC